MYSGKMAFAVKVAGKILREIGDSVFLPFGSEYSLIIKNLNNRRASVKISIDGQDAVDGGLIVNANSTIELERFVKATQLDKGNRFKFIERNSKVEETRGIKVEDGLIRVEFEFEKEYPKVDSIFRNALDDWSKTYRSYSGPVGSLGSFSGSESQKEVYTSSASINQLLSKNATSSAEVKTSSVGITVPGSVSEQKFVSTYFQGDGQTTVLVMHLFGETDSAPVKEAVVVKPKQKCITCGHVNKKNAKFCSECGTSLEIV